MPQKDKKNALHSSLMLWGHVKREIDFVINSLKFISFVRNKRKAVGK